MPKPGKKFSGFEVGIGPFTPREVAKGIPKRISLRHGAASQTEVIVMGPPVNH